MPSYFYICSSTACQHNQDTPLNIHHSIQDSPHQKCPTCQSMTLKPFITSVPFILKGKGWVEDNYEKMQKTKNSSSSEESSKKD